MTTDIIRSKMTAPIRTLQDQDVFEDERKEEFNLLKQSKAFTNKRTKRQLLPAIRERSSIRGLISFMKSVLGKDLTKVTMPVNFNEPVSFLQRLAEDLEYADILNRACFCKNSLVRLAHVAAFASSTYATVLGRFWKPFNPLLGETFEYINHDVGYALIAEQVSHHPPISALHAESDHWVFWQEYSLDTKFRGQFFKVIPTGFCHVKFKASGHHFCWKKPVTTVHNILVGGLSVDQEGDVVVTNLSTKEQCTLHFLPIRKVQENFKKLTGEVRDVEGHVKYLISGSWDKSLECQPVEDVNDAIDLWSATRRPEESPKMYAFTRFTMQLNDPDYDTTCPTDCRKRPDIRLLENGKIELSSVQKHRLEEKQRHAKRDREASGEVWAPRWFEIRDDPRSATSAHVYKGGYWTTKLQNSFTDTPDIY